MSDIVTFGLAPSIFFAVDAGAYGRPWSALALVAAAGYVVAVLLRLARYASEPDEGTGRSLVGLPSPPSAMAATALVVLHPPAPLALAGFVTLSALMVASFPFPRIDAATAPLMGAWWAFAAVTATRVIPPWPVAAFTLAAISGLLLLVPLRRYAPGLKTVSIAASARSIVSTRE
jgi:phosphatidylserine synthase